MVEVLVFDETKPVRLDLACGDNKKEGYFGIDKWKTDSTDAVFDLTDKKWPIEDGVVDELWCSHFFEHLRGDQRPAFMEECHRILKPGAKLIIITPYWTSSRSVQDFTHQWPPLTEASYLYFNKTWREQNKLTHGLYDIKCNFDFGCGYALDPDVSVKNQEYQAFAVKHYTNAASDLYVTLTKVV